MNQKDLVRDVFNRAAPLYGEKNCSFFDYFGKRLVELSKVASGKKVLDVATGKGAVLFPIAHAIGREGKVIGIDLSEKMLQENFEKIQFMNWIDLQRMDAENLTFADNSFDFVFCGFALFLFPSLSIALTEFRRVLKPGGKIAVSIWGRPPELTSWVMEHCEKSLLATPLDNETLNLALHQAKFQEINILEERKKFLFGTPEEWWESLWAHGTRAGLEQLSALELENLKEKALQKAREKVVEELHVFYGIAEK